LPDHKNHAVDFRLQRGFFCMPCMALLSKV
jgi:hypothetical protein